jgi:fatty-acyl-CoA synthase
VLEGLMQNDFPLTLQHLLRRMRTSQAQVITLDEPGSLQRASQAQVCERIDRLARALQALGVREDDRVGTFAWNNQRHFELYFAIPCLGAVLHTLNIRLFEEQITYIVNHAKDRVIFVDDSLVPALEKLAPAFQTVEHYVIMGDGDTGQLPGALRYEELLEQAGPGEFDYPELDERQAAALCYTSGTTGNPKGVLYSHRSVALHSTVVTTPDANLISSRDRILAVVPMFHVNAWGLPFAAAMARTDLIMPNRYLQAEPLTQLIVSERPTMLAGVPTIFNDLLRYADEHGPDLSSLVNCIIGGSAAPVQLLRDFQERHGVVIHHAWGMTETSPICTLSRPPALEDEEEYWRLRASQGRAVAWVELRLIGDDGQEVPWDGESTGEIEVRGPWIASSYYNDPSGDDKFHDGWLRTGDIGSLDGAGYLRITDRSKDVIKSGGEWISSVELENEVMAHPDVVEAAVIAKPDERWAERPLCCVVLREGAETSAEELREHLRGRVAKWWLPDEFAFVAEIPKTSVGKFDKKVLRARLEQGTLEGRVAAPEGQLTRS